MDSLCVTSESSSTGRCKCFEAGRAPRAAPPERFLEHSSLGRGPVGLPERLGVPVGVGLKSP